MFNNFRAQNEKSANTAEIIDISESSEPKPIEVAVLDPEMAAKLELKSNLHELLLDRLNLSVIDKVERSELRRQIAELVGQVLEEDELDMSPKAMHDLVDELIFEVLGLGPLEPLLADPTINDILVNAHDNIYIERHGILEKCGVSFRDERHLLRIIDKIVSKVGRRIDESQPWVDARLDDGSRVNAIIRPLAVDGPALSIRKFSTDPFTMQKLVDLGALPPEAATILKGLVAARLNVLISGGTGSGKTTMLNAMSSYIPHSHRIVTIEDAAELQLQQDHVVRLETRTANIEGKGAVGQRELMKNALRMRPDRIIVGEVRGSETFDMLQAMNTGHDGSMTTVHANTARDALGRLEQMVTMLGAELPIRTIRSQIEAALTVVVQLNRLSDGRRRVTSISEITGMEGDVITMQDIFAFRRTGLAEDGSVKGHFVCTGIRPKCADAMVAAGVKFADDMFHKREYEV